MSRARAVIDLVGQILIWAHRSGRHWLPLALVALVLGSLIVVGTKATVTTFVYTLF